MKQQMWRSTALILTQSHSNLSDGGQLKDHVELLFAWHTSGLSYARMAAQVGVTIQSLRKFFRTHDAEYRVYQATHAQLDREE